MVSNTWELTTELQMDLLVLHTDWLQFTHDLWELGWKKLFNHKLLTINVFLLYTTTTASLQFGCTQEITLSSIFTP